jgi:taurine transport system permease protein
LAGAARLLGGRRGDAMRRTVAFGDAGAVRSSGAASVLSVVAIVLLWAAFTGSALVPSWLRVPGAFTGEASFAYTAEAPDGTRDDASVTVLVHPLGEEPEVAEPAPGEGFAADDAAPGAARAERAGAGAGQRRVTARTGARIVAVDGSRSRPGGAPVALRWGRVD